MLEGDERPKEIIERFMANVESLRGYPMTLQEIADVFDISPDDVLWYLEGGAPIIEDEE